MNHIIIIGNSGAARECYWLFQTMLDASPLLASEYDFGGFLSWEQYKGDLKNLQHLFLGDIANHIINQGNLYVIGIGAPRLRKEVYEYCKRKRANFFTLRHPLSDINPSAHIGEANIFQGASTVFCDAQLGNANYLNGAVNLSHDANVGNYNFFGPFSLVLGDSYVGDENMFATRCTVLPHARVGNMNIIAPYSVVYKGCGNGERVAGNPALCIGKCLNAANQGKGL